MEKTRTRETDKFTLYDDTGKVYGIIEKTTERYIASYKAGEGGWSVISKEYTTYEGRPVTFYEQENKYKTTDPLTGEDIFLYEKGRG